MTDEPNVFGFDPEAPVPEEEWRALTRALELSQGFKLFSGGALTIPFRFVRAVDPGVVIIPWFILGRFSAVSGYVKPREIRIETR